jgi:hypothetical protein
VSSPAIALDGVSAIDATPSPQMTSAKRARTGRLNIMVTPQLREFGITGNVHGNVCNGNSGLLMTKGFGNQVRIAVNTRRHRCGTGQRLD